MRVYLDTCCYYRFFDSPQQQRIRDESRAVDAVLEQSELGQVVIVGSEVLDLEIQQDPDSNRRLRATRLIARCTSEWHAVDSARLATAGRMQLFGVGRFDSMHLAVALQVEASCLLTVDDQFLKRARKVLQGSQLRVLTPIEFLAANP